MHTHKYEHIFQNQSSNQINTEYSTQQLHLRTADNTAEFSSIFVVHEMKKHRPTSNTLQYLQQIKAVTKCMLRGLHAWTA